MFLRRVMPLSLVAAWGLGLAACASHPQTEGLSEYGSYRCGQLDIRIAGTEGSNLIGLEYLDRRVLLKPAPTDSGTLYVAPGDPGTRFRARQSRGLLTLNGETLPECLEPGAVESSFLAIGADPSWSARIEDRQLDLTIPYGQGTLQGVRLTETLANRHGRAYEAKVGPQTLSLRIARQLCEVGLDAVQYPAQARLTLDGQTFEGCGGDRQRLLRGVEWVVQDLASTGIIDRSRVTVRFLADNRLAGRASCNRYTGGYRLSDNDLVFQSLASTRMACAPALMHQERKFLALMAGVVNGRIGRHGELLLETEDGGVITALPATAESF